MQLTNLEKNETAKERLISKIKAQPTKSLKDIAKSLMTNYEPGTGAVFDHVLRELETRMQEQEFIDFVENI